jgi:hypothetical protein
MLRDGLGSFGSRADELVMRLCCKVPENSRCPRRPGWCWPVAAAGNARQSKLTTAVYYRVQTEGLQLD